MKLQRAKIIAFLIKMDWGLEVKRRGRKAGAHFSKIFESLAAKDLCVPKAHGPFPRLPLRAHVVVHKEDRFLRGSAFNVSKSGIFVKTRKSYFKANERVVLYIRPFGLSRSFRLQAVVRRFNTDVRHPLGYGLQFQTPISLIG